MLQAAADPSAGDPSQFLRDPIDCLMRVYRRHGTGVTNGFGRQDVVFALGPACNYAIHTQPELFVATGYLLPGPKHSAQRRLTFGVFNQNGERHRDHRRLMMPIFQKASWVPCHDAVAAICGAFLADWRWGETRDISAELLALVVRLNARLLLGVMADDLVRQLEQATEESMALNARLTVATALALDLPRSWYGDALASSERVETLTRQVLELRKTGSSDGADLLGQLLRTHAADPGRLTAVELVAQAAHLFAAANQSTRSSLIWTLILLAQHPAVMADLFDELDQELRGAPPGLEQIERLPLLERVYRESVRLFPPICYFTRATAEATELCGQRLARGTTVVFSHYVTHHLPTAFPEPERFFPDRWLAADPSPYEYLPFGIGPRMCLGITFAGRIARMVLATLLQRARLTILPGTRIDRQVTTILRPRHPVPMRIDRPGGPYAASAVVGDVHEMVHLPAAPAVAA